MKSNPQSTPLDLALTAIRATASASDAPAAGELGPPPTDAQLAGRLRRVPFRGRVTAVIWRERHEPSTRRAGTR